MNFDNTPQFVTAVEILKYVVKVLSSSKGEGETSGVVKPSFSLTVGSGNTDNHPTSLHLSYLPFESDAAKKVRDLAGATQYAQSVIIILSFTVKDEVDVFSLGDLSATFKNVIPKEWATTRSKVTKLEDGSKAYELILTVLPGAVFPAITEIFARFRPSQLDANLSFSQVPQYGKNEEFIEAKLSFSATLSKHFNNWIQSLIPLGFADFLEVLNKGNVELEFDNLTEFYKAALPDIPEEYKFLNWNLLAQLLLEPLVALHITDRYDSSADAKAIMLNFLRKMDEYLNGIHAVTLMAGDDILRVDCKHFDIVHLIPPEREILARKDLMEKVKEEKRIQEEMERALKEFKVVVLGDGGVGKSAITVQYVQGIFVERYDPTIEDSYRKLAYIDNSEVMFEILDTAGNQQFTAMRDLYMKNGQGFVLVYSISSRGSFSDIPDLVDQIARVKDVDPPDLNLIIVGNKNDLTADRAVEAEEGRQLAARYKCDFIETSAKFRVNIDEIFTTITRKHREKLTKKNK